MSKKLIALITTICILLSVSLPVSAIGNTDNASSERVHEIMPRNYPDGPYHEVENVLYKVTQNKSNWCWAACIESVVYWYGLDISQELVVERRQLVDPQSGDNNKKANAAVVVKVLNSLSQRYANNKFKAVSHQGTLSVDEIRNYVDAGVPMMFNINLGGYDNNHWVICSGYIASDPDGFDNVNHLLIVDPSEDCPDKMRLIYDEYNDLLYYPSGHYDNYWTEQHVSRKITNVVTIEKR